MRFLVSFLLAASLWACGSGERDRGPPSHPLGDGQGDATIAGDASFGDATIAGDAFAQGDELGGDSGATSYALEGGLVSANATVASPGYQLTGGLHSATVVRGTTFELVGGLARPTR